MPGFFLMVFAAFVASTHNDAPRQCYWETRHAPICEAYTAWVKAPHRPGERFQWNGSRVLPGALPEL